MKGRNSNHAAGHNRQCVIQLKAPQWIVADAMLHQGDKRCYLMPEDVGFRQQTDFGSAAQSAQVFKVTLKRIEHPLL